MNYTNEDLRLIEKIKTLNQKVLTMDQVFQFVENDPWPISTKRVSAILISMGFKKHKSSKDRGKFHYYLS